ncbi:MAG TPA: A24 family peptidase [Nitrospiraceae bacterium]|nr:A24 family peptidase [Nitrospiraceae bacterium]
MLAYFGIFMIGLVVGSFLNVCIHRIPLQKSVMWRSSQCPHCATPIKLYDNIPLLSYVFLRARCRSCQTPISFRYPMVEVLNGIGYALIVWRFGWGFPSVVYAVLFSALLIVTWIDLAHQIIPDRITLPGIGLGLLCASTVLPVGLIDSFLGVVVGGGVLWGVAWISPYLFGKEGMGGGDIKLLAMVGAFLGWKPTLLTILIGAVAGSVVGIGLILFKAIRRDQYVPFGPFLACGAIISMFYHHDILRWYISLLTVAR